jgi:hypothetical protein
MSIEFGDIRLTLGLPQNEVLGRLAEKYRIDRIDDGTYFVATKLSSNEQYDVVGTIRFRQGKLVSVYRPWVPAHSNGAELARSFYRLARVFVQEGRTACTLGVAENEMADGENHSVVIKCGGKSIEVHVTRTHHTKEVATVEEVLEAE